MSDIIKYLHKIFMFITFQAVSSETNDHVKQSKVSEEFHSATNKAKNSSNATLRKACKTVNGKVSKRNKKQHSDTSKISDNKKADSVNFVAECYYKTVTFSAEDFSARLKRLRGEEEKEESVDSEDIEDPGDTEASDISSNHSSYSCGNSEFEVSIILLCHPKGLVLAKFWLGPFLLLVGQIALSICFLNWSLPTDHFSLNDFLCYLLFTHSFFEKGG